MSLNRALTEMFKAIREEASRNPEFAARLDEAMSIYKPAKRRRPPAALGSPKAFNLPQSLARDEPAQPGEARSDAQRPPAPGPRVHDVDAPHVEAQGVEAHNDAAQDAQWEAGDAHDRVAHGQVVELNPIVFLSREGEAALREELARPAYSRQVLALLIAEHNLDPAREAVDADKDALIEQILSQVKKRVARDKALFNY